MYAIRCYLVNMYSTPCVGAPSGVSYICFLSARTPRLLPLNGKQHVSELSRQLEQSPVAGSGASQSVLPRPSMPPWHVLVCAGLGYEDLDPHPVDNTTWDEFMASRGAALKLDRHGETCHQVRALADLRAESFEPLVPGTAALAQLQRVLGGLLDGTLNDARAGDEIRAVSGGGPLRTRILNALAAPHATASDRHDALVRLAAETAAIRTQELRRLLEQPGINGPRGAWMALRHLVSAAGTSGACTVRVCSASRERMEQSLQAVLESCTSAACAPDMLVWDYPLHIVMTDMKALAHVASLAATHSVMVLASVARDEPLVDSAMNEESIRELLLDDSQVPLRRFRRNADSRFVTLCAPRVRVDTSQLPAPECGSAWLVAHDVVRMLVDGGSPLAAMVPAGEELEKSFQFTVSGNRAIDPGVVLEGHQAGLVLLSDRGEGHLPLCTIVNPDVHGREATLFGYELLRARLQRLCRAHAGHWAPDAAPSAAAQDLKEYLLTLSGPLHLGASERAVRTGTDSRTVWAEVSADGAADLPPLRITVDI